MIPTFLKVYPLVVLAVVALDLLWLGVVMKDFYRAQLSHLIGTSVVWSAAFIFYLVFAAGLMYFAILPAVGGSWTRALFLGAALGALCYATYDLTNHATLKEWPLAVTLIDIAWGTFLSGVVSVVGHFTYQWF